MESFPLLIQRLSGACDLYWCPSRLTLCKLLFLVKESPTAKRQLDQMSRSFLLMKALQVDALADNIAFLPLATFCRHFLYRFPSLILHFHRAPSRTPPDTIQRNARCGAPVVSYLLPEQASPRYQIIPGQYENLHQSSSSLRSPFRRKAAIRKVVLRKASPKAEFNCFEFFPFPGARLVTRE